jgi:putative oxidoreductase
MVSIMNTDVLNQPAPNARSDENLHYALWGAQGLLALFFALGGLMKATTPIAELASKMVWAADVPEALVRFIGVTQLLGAIGLVLPGLTKLKTRLTPLAASGLALTMLLAALFHVARGELFMLPMNAALGALASFVVWGRFWKLPLGARQAIE